MVRIGPVKIIGVGNRLMGDDGIGVAVVERLAALWLPPEVEVIDGGTGGITLLGIMEGASAVVLVDAVTSGSAPGTIMRFDAESLQGGTFAPSTHPALLDVLALGREMGMLPPRLVVFGVEPHTVSPGVTLSSCVGEAIDPLLSQILDEIPSLTVCPGLPCLSGK